MDFGGEVVGIGGKIIGDGSVDIFAVFDFELNVFGDYGVVAIAQN